MRNQIELNYLAVELRKKLGEDSFSPIDVFTMVSGSDELTVLFYPMSGKISGMCIADENIKIIGINSNNTYGRQRFTIAHELYHMYYQGNVSRTLCLKDLDAKKDTTEKEADMFASFFLAPYDAFREFIERRINKKSGELDIFDVIRIEQHFGFSRQAILWRLISEGYLQKTIADGMKLDIIQTAKKMGLDEKLYLPTEVSKKYYTIGKYIKSVEYLSDKGKISSGKHEEFLMDAFRGDIVFGPEGVEEEVYD